MIPSHRSALDRIRTLGIRAASPIDLIAIAVSQDEDSSGQSELLARDLLAQFLNIQNLSAASPADLTERTSMSPFEVTRFLATAELGRRAALAGKGDPAVIDGPEDVFRLLKDLRHEKREHFVAILMNAKNEVLRVANIHIGTLNMSVVGAREVFREAIREGASSLIVAHNHPSGDPEPSPEDIEVTDGLVKVGDMLDIPVNDHVIIGERRFVSLRARRLMD